MDSGRNAKIYADTNLTKLKKVNGNIVENNNKVVFQHFPFEIGSSLIKLWLRFAGEANFRIAKQQTNNKTGKAKQNKTQKNV